MRGVVSRLAAYTCRDSDVLPSGGHLTDSTLPHSADLQVSSNSAATHSFDSNLSQCQHGCLKQGRLDSASALLCFKQAQCSMSKLILW